jgi:hypothetical protein
MMVPCLGLWLATQGEVNWERGVLEADRLWLVNEGGADPQTGLAWAATRLIPSAADHLVCARTQVTFFMWQGRGENSAYCECYRLMPDGDLEYVTACP